MVKRIVIITMGLFFLVLAFSGCATTKKVKTLETQNERIEGENTVLRQELESAKNTIGEKDMTITELEKEKEEQRASAEGEIAILKETYDRLVQDLQKEIQSGVVAIEQVKGRLNLIIAEQLFFETGKAEIKPEGQEVLRRIGTILRKIPQKNVRVEGHTDSVPISPSLRAKYPTNWELGSARATNVVRFLEEQVGMDPLRLSAVSYGQYRPVASNSTAAGKAKNRRIEIVLIDRDLDRAKKMKQNL